MRKLNSTDQFFTQLDGFLTTIWGKPSGTAEPNPASKIKEAILSDKEKKHAIALMRVNHTGEVCAQALYQSQSLYSQSEAVRKALLQSMMEENNHLIWCQERIEELGGKTSLLNPIFYQHSFLLGAIAGSFGDAYSMGFIVETEKQVENHLNQYIDKLPKNDQKSKAILTKMRADEIHHGNQAEKQGAKPLPSFVQFMMKITAEVMTKTTYYI